MPRPLWSGSLSFGLVNVPVRLVSASVTWTCTSASCTRRTTCPSRSSAGARRREARSRTRRSLASYEFEDGDTVVVTDDELEGWSRSGRGRSRSTVRRPRRGRPDHFDHHTCCMPAGDNEGALRAYRLLLEVMRADRPRGARALRDAHEGVRALVRARDGALSLTTMRMHDEVRRDGRRHGSARARREEAAGRCERAHRGDERRVGPHALRGPLPRSGCRRSSSRSARARRSRRPRPGRRALAGARPHGRAAREPGRRARAAPASKETRQGPGWRSSPATSSTSARRRRTCRAARR